MRKFLDLQYYLNRRRCCHIGYIAISLVDKGCRNITYKGFNVVSQNSVPKLCKKFTLTSIALRLAKPCKFFAILSAIQLNYVGPDKQKFCV